MSTTASESLVACWACGTGAQPDGDLGAPFVRCPRCGLSFWRDVDEDVRAIYADFDYFENHTGERPYQDEAQRSSEAQTRVRHVAQHVPAGGRLLELGAADGHFLKAADAAGFAMLGVEPVPEAARLATERSGVTVVAGFLADVPLEAASFDGVCAWHVLEHIPDPHDDLVRVREALKPGGKLILEVPNAASVTAEREGMAWWQREPTVHVAQYRPGALRALLERAGFLVRELTTVPIAIYDADPRRRVLRELVGGVRLRTAHIAAHPWKHEQLRAIAERPA